MNIERRPLRRPQKKGITYGGRSGWVYFVRIVAGPTKIGLTISDPERRVLQIDRTVPYPLQAIGFIQSDDVGTLESQLHVQFDKWWLKGEWFDLPDDEIHRITLRPDFKTPEAVVEHLHTSFLSQMDQVRNLQNLEPPFDWGPIHAEPELEPWPVRRK